jgi:endoglucanase
MQRAAAMCLGACGLLSSACGGFEVPPEEMPGAGGAADDGPRHSRAICAADDDSELPMTHPQGIRAVGNRLEDENGTPLFLRGVNRSGSEYRCIQDQGFFDGACDEASVRAMKSWNINTVRVPLNESCWLGINGAPDDLGGRNYKAAIQSYVFLLHKHGLIPILDLHWSRSGEDAANRLDPMPNADHSPEFWRDVAETFKDDTGVIFEPFNEPFPDRNQDTDAAWACWRDGCTARSWEADSVDYQAAGMQDLVTAIRDTGATQLILLGGVEYSNALSQWRDHRPTDPLENLGAAWHIYNFNRCSNDACWNGVPLDLAADVPVVATEIGQDDCEGDFISPLMSFLDQHGAGYLAWSWNVGGQCVAASDGAPGNPWPLIDHFEAAQPNSAYARAFRDHVLEMTP